MSCFAKFMESINHVSINKLDRILYNIKKRSDGVFATDISNTKNDEVILSVQYTIKLSTGSTISACIEIPWFTKNELIRILKQTIYLENNIIINESDVTETVNDYHAKGYFEKIVNLDLNVEVFNEAHPHLVILCNILYAIHKITQNVNFSIMIMLVVLERIYYDISYTSEDILKIREYLSSPNREYFSNDIYEILEKRLNRNE